MCTGGGSGGVPVDPFGGGGSNPFGGGGSNSFGGGGSGAIYLPTTAAYPNLVRPIVLAGTGGAAEGHCHLTLAIWFYNYN